MKELTDTDIYYLLLSAISSPAGLIFACTAFLVLVFTLGMVIGLFRTVYEMKTDCKEILKNK
jgi:hypothetical protein